LSFFNNTPLRNRRDQADARPPAVVPVALSATPQVNSRLGLSGALAAHEKALVEDALHASDGRVFGPSGAAARLAIPRSTLESKIRVLRIDKSRHPLRRPKGSSAFDRVP